MVEMIKKKCFSCGKLAKVYNEEYSDYQCEDCFREYEDQKSKCPDWR